MTRSPLAVTVSSLLPLVALAWPLSDVLNQEGYQPPPPAPSEASTTPLITADLAVLSAHPFESISVTIAGATWTYGPDDDEKEIHFPTGDTVVLKVSVTWPPETPETAALIRLIPQNRKERSHTLWGFLDVTEEITFTWEDTP